MLEAHSSRGVAFGDFDNDGDIDILIMNMNEPPSLLRNDMTRKQSLAKVLLIGVASNRSAIGAHGGGHLWRSQTGAGRDGAVLIPLGERPAPALRAGRRDLSGRWRFAGRTDCARLSQMWAPIS